MTLTKNSETSTPPVAVGTHFHAGHGTKTNTVFLATDVEPLVYYFQVQSPYYQVTQCNQKTPIAVYLK